MGVILVRSQDIQQTLVLIKPDALLYSLTGFIIERISAILNPIIAASKVVRVSRELAEAHYANIQGKSFFENTINYIMGELHYPDQPEKRRVMAIVYEGTDIVNKVKKYFGPTRPADAKQLAKEDGIITLRAQLSYSDYSVDQEEHIDNVVHASADRTEAEREVLKEFIDNAKKMVEFHQNRLERYQQCYDQLKAKKAFDVSLLLPAELRSLRGEPLQPEESTYPTEGERLRTGTDG